MTSRERFTQEFWDARYRRHHHLWSGRPNPHLVAEAAGLDPARALDVGCGEGGDAIWLAQQGWAVTGADVSMVGLERAEANAAAAGPEIAAATRWRHVDLFAEPEEWEPLGEHELVNSQYLHLPPEVRGRALDRLADAVAIGGHLLIVAHHPSDLEIPGLRPNLPELFCTPSELAAGLDPAGWEIVTASEPERTARGPDDQPVTIRDTVLHARRIR
ncbi:MAG: class I SAM-dependent methyltransferase [Solirubrobacteraceae bacterium]